MMTGAAAMAGSSAALGRAKRLPVGLELYSVRDELAKDLMGTVRAVPKMGYEVVEFYAPYFTWTAAYAKEVQKLLEDPGKTQTGSLGLAAQAKGRAPKRACPDAIQ